MITLVRSASLVNGRFAEGTVFVQEMAELATRIMGKPVDVLRPVGPRRT
jgi:hypothetical protein